MKNERYLEHEAMVKRVLETSDGDPQGLTDSDVAALTHCLETVSDRERETWGRLVEDAIRERNRLRMALVEIYVIAQTHREWAISGRCVTALGPGVPGISAPPEKDYCAVCDKVHEVMMKAVRVCEPSERHGEEP